MARAAWEALAVTIVNALLLTLGDETLLRLRDAIAGRGEARG